MLADTHIHTEFSGDSTAPMAEQIEAAIALGMKEICITDHHDYGTRAMTHIDYTLDLPAYLPAVRREDERVREQIRVNIGVELGLMLREKEYLTRLAEELPVDYLIGSMHFIDGYDVYDRSYYEGRTEKESYGRFFDVTFQRLSELDCYDSLGHLDYIIRYGPEKNKNYCPADYMDRIDEILRLLIRRGKALECNTAGFKYGLGHPHPYEEILKRYRELGGELLTIGSDAHRPREVGGYFSQTEEILRNIGFRWYTVFHERKPVFYKL